MDTSLGHIHRESDYQIQWILYQIEDIDYLDYFVQTA